MSHAHWFTMKMTLFSLGVLLLGALCVAAFFSPEPTSPTPAALSPITHGSAGGKGVHVRSQGNMPPSAPRQNVPWSHPNEAFSNAAATLFEQGLADPRGLEYREIEVAIGEPWTGGGSPFKTHGWLLPHEGKDGRFAVAWNGLIYPVVRVGAPAHLREDFARQPKAAPLHIGRYQQTSEKDSVDFHSPTALKLVLLTRLGETDIVNQLSPIIKSAGQSDPYPELARDWAWFAFERAVCAHERGDDRLALADARLLSRIQPLIEAEAKRRGVQQNAEHLDSRSADRPAFLPFLGQLPLLLSDSERRVANSRSPARRLGKKEKSVAALIDDLENVNARQWGQPGGVSVTDDARVQALVKHGNEAVEPLLHALESDERLTRSVSFGRDFFRDRHLISVSQAAYAALVDLLHVSFENSKKNGKPLSRKELAGEIRAYWAQMGTRSPAERFYLTLKDDRADKDQWLQAAANIVQPTDVESHGGWVTIPRRKAGQKIVLRGESLRDGRTPSVAQLMARRSDAIAAARTGSSQDQFLYVNAGQMALYLADWDQRAAIPTLRKRLQRVWSSTPNSEGPLVSSRDDIERVGKTVVEMTLARGRGEDLSGYDEYAAWVQQIEPKGIFLRDEELQKPLVLGENRPSIRQAIESLFQSPWANVLVAIDYSGIVQFWGTPLARTAGFRKQALRALEDKTLAGTIVFDPRSEWSSHREAWIRIKTLNMQYTGSNGDPDTPPAGETKPFRVCDIYAYFFSQRQHGPKMQLFWPEKKRNAAVLATRQWLQAKSK